MIPLYRSEFYTFTFAADRLVGRFHLDGVAAGTPVTVFALDPETDGPGGRLAEATAGPGGWVDLPGPLVVRAGGGFLARPGGESDRERCRPRGGR